MDTNADIGRKSGSALQRADTLLAMRMKGFLRQEIENACIELWPVGTISEDNLDLLTHLRQSMVKTFNERFWHSGIVPRYLFWFSMDKLPTDHPLIAMMTSRGFAFRELEGRLFCHFARDPEPFGVADPLDGRNLE